MTLAIAVEDAGWGDPSGLEDLAQRVTSAAFAAMGTSGNSHELSIVFTDDETVRRLNDEWRGKNYATNVLSFPADHIPLPPGELQPLGDIVFAHGVVAREAAEQGKTLPDHVAHLMIHGLLHLFGHDHMDDAEASRMEDLEIEILKGLGIANPYE